jgi:hypothetical protein
MRPRGWVVVCVLATGCDAEVGETVRSDAPETDTSTIDAAPVCFADGEFKICVADVPATLDITTATTADACSVVDPARTTWCVLAARDITIGATLRGVGTAPLVLVATNTLTITPTGVVDVSSHASATGGSAGAAANSASCGLASLGTSSLNGGGGGPGGSFSTLGGEGANGGSGGISGGEPGAAITTLPTTLRGGCPGKAGGDGAAAPEPGGAGGGVVYLVAGTQLVVRGAVNASGAGGGRGLPAKSGGSGGGSGGMIALWSPAITVEGQVFANGGGGGGGADNGVPGVRGGDSPSFDVAGAGGFGGGTTACGAGPGCGGRGAFGTGDGVVGVEDMTGAGGGGGGGGLGLVYVVSGQTLTGNLSPASKP